MPMPAPWVLITSMMLRYIRSIGEHGRHGSPSLGLVTVKPHPKYSNRRQVFLTDKGRLVAKEILQQLYRSERVM